MRIVLAVTVLIALCAPAHVLADKLLFSDGFENRSLSKWKPSGNNTVKIVNSHTREGNYSAYISLHRTKDRVNYRTEIKPTIGYFKMGGVYRIEFSIYIPSNWKNDKTGDILTQIHAMPDQNAGESWRQPVLALSVQNESWKIMNRSDSSRVTTEKSFRGRTLHTSPLQKGAWSDWVIEARWTHQSNGYLKIWKNGSQVVNYSGPNAYNDERGPYPKFGIYKTAWKKANQKEWGHASNTDFREMYLDSVLIKQLN